MISTTLNALNLSEIHTQIQSRLGCHTERSGQLCHCGAIPGGGSPRLWLRSFWFGRACPVHYWPLLWWPYLQSMKLLQSDKCPLSPWFLVKSDIWWCLWCLPSLEPQAPRWGFCKVLYKSHQSQIEQQWRQGVNGKHRFLPKVYIFLQGQVSKTSGIQIRNIVSYSEKAQAKENWNFLVMLT